jgi:hypothetical protein
MMATAGTDKGDNGQRGHATLSRTVPPRHRSWKGVERLEMGIGERVIVNEKVVASDKERPGLGHLQVVEGLHRAGLHGGDLDEPLEATQHVTGFELTSHGPAMAGTPEAVVDAANQ